MTAAVIGIYTVLAAALLVAALFTKGSDLSLLCAFAGIATLLALVVELVLVVRRSEWLSMMKRERALARREAEVRLAERERSVAEAEAQLSS